MISTVVFITSSWDNRLGQDSNRTVTNYLTNHGSTVENVTQLIAEEIELQCIHIANFLNSTL